MTIDNHLYVGKMPDRMAASMVRKIKKFKLCAGVCVVTLPVFGEGLLEVYDFNEFQQGIYKHYMDDIHIVGIAPSKKLAYYVVRDIIDDVYKNTGTFDCDTYFKYVL